jgi:inner membrane protein
VLAAALAGILVADEALHRLALPWLLGGLFDEPAHLATAVLVHANLSNADSAWATALAVGSVAPDADHVPLIPVRHKLGKDDPRPALHTLLTPAAVAAAACFTRARAREALGGLAAGICVHFVRDVASGTGLAVIQPLARWRIKLPRRSYQAGMAFLAWRAWRLER